MRVLVLLGVLWAVVALAKQLRDAHGGGRRDFSSRRGDANRGVLYNLTVAMRPGHKETVTFHPMKFGIGFLMHLGLFISLVGILLLAINPSMAYGLFSFCRPLIAAALLAGTYLFFRRIFSGSMRAMSSPDDYVGILATCGLLGVTSIWRVGPENMTVCLGYAVLLFIYLPLGKLRHAAFFFATRIDVGRRLGYRGVYPPAPAEME